jgi:hypothetical protein
MADAITPSADAFGDVIDQLNALDVKLAEVRHFASVLADITGGRISDTVEVDAEAMSSTMGFFADHLSSARSDIGSIHALVGRLRRTCS